MRRVERHVLTLVVITLAVASAFFELSTRLAPALMFCAIASIIMTVLIDMKEYEDD